MILREALDQLLQRYPGGYNFLLTNGRVIWAFTNHRQFMMLKGSEGADEITLFADGRALVHGPMTPERARSWYTEVIGC